MNKIEDDLKAFEEEVEFEVNKFYHYGRCVLIMHKKICDGGLKKWKKWEVKDSAKDYKKIVRKFMKSKEVDEIDKFEKAPEDAWKDFKELKEDLKLEEFKKTPFKSFDNFANHVLTDYHNFHVSVPTDNVGTLKVDGARKGTQLSFDFNMGHGIGRSGDIAAV